MSVKPMSKEEVLALPAIVDVVTAGRAFGFGSTLARELVRDGKFPCPVLPLGRRKRVTRSAILQVLGIKDPDASPADGPERGDRSAA